MKARRTNAPLLSNPPIGGAERKRPFFNFLLAAFALGLLASGKADAEAGAAAQGARDQAETVMVKPFSGNGLISPFVAGSTVRFAYFLSGIATDTAGNLYVADMDNSRICKVSPEGVSTPFAGSGEEGYADGGGSVARFDSPQGIAIDKAGNLYVADRNGSIRKITPEGEVTSIVVSFPAMKNRDTASIAVDAAGNLYIAGTGDDSIRKTAPEGTVTRIAFPARKNHPLYRLGGIATDTAGNLYVTDTDKHSIHKVTPEGKVTTLAGSGGKGYADGAGRTAKFDSPKGITIDAADNLYVADTKNGRIRKITPKGNVSTVVGRKKNRPHDISIHPNDSVSMAIDKAGNLYVMESGHPFALQEESPHFRSGHLWKIAPDGEVSTIAESERLAGVFSIAIDAAGSLYVGGTEMIYKVVFATEPSD